jgi:hypothetical protein
MPAVMNEFNLKKRRNRLTLVTLFVTLAFDNESIAHRIDEPNYL